MAVARQRGVQPAGPDPARLQPHGPAPHTPLVQQLRRVRPRPRVGRRRLGRPAVRGPGGRVRRAARTVRGLRAARGRQRAPGRARPAGQQRLLSTRGPGTGGGLLRDHLRSGVRPDVPHAVVSCAWLRHFQFSGRASLCFCFDFFKKKKKKASIPTAVGLLITAIGWPTTVGQPKSRGHFSLNCLPVAVIGLRIGRNARPSSPPLPRRSAASAPAPSLPGRPHGQCRPRRPVPRRWGWGAPGPRAPGRRTGYVAPPPLPLAPAPCVPVPTAAVVSTPQTPLPSGRHCIADSGVGGTPRGRSSGTTVPLPRSPPGVGVGRAEDPPPECERARTPGSARRDTRSASMAHTPSHAVPSAMAPPVIHCAVCARHRAQRAPPPAPWARGPSPGPPSRKETFEMALGGRARGPAPGPGASMAWPSEGGEAGDGRSPGLWCVICAAKPPPPPSPPDPQLFRGQGDHSFHRPPPFRSLLCDQPQPPPPPPRPCRGCVGGGGTELPGPRGRRARLPPPPPARPHASSSCDDDNVIPHSVRPSANRFAAPHVPHRLQGACPSKGTARHGPASAAPSIPPFAPH